MPLAAQPGVRMTFEGPSLDSSSEPSARRDAQPRIASAPTLVLGPRIALTGILQVQGLLRIEGRFSADVQCGSLLIAPAAVVDGVLVADRVEVEGVASGQIFANEIVLKRGCRVEAELYFRMLELEAGALFEGRSRRHDNPLALGPHFPPAAWGALVRG